MLFPFLNSVSPLHCSILPFREIALPSLSVSLFLLFLTLTCRSIIFYTRMIRPSTWFFFLTFSYLFSHSQSQTLSHIQWNRMNIDALCFNAVIMNRFIYVKEIFVNDFRFRLNFAIYFPTTGMREGSGKPT